MSIVRPKWPRWRYGKRLLWRSEDRWGPVEVVNGPLGRALHFGGEALQGRCHFDLPWLPVAEYLKTMVGAAAFPPPQSRQSDHSLPNHPSICLLGLGTGSLAWSYRHLMPHAKLVAVELRQAVIDAGRACFRIDELELEVIHDDAANALQLLPIKSQTLIAIDLFMASGMVPILNRNDFWHAISKSIHPSGVVCVNTWSGDPQKFQELCELVKKWVCPGGDLLMVDHIGFGNVTLFAVPRPCELAQVIARAEHIDRAFAQAPPWNRKQQREADRVGLTKETLVERLTRAKLHGSR